MPQIEYDVFLSHNSIDKPFVEEIARRLKEHKFRPFLDKWNLVPGAPWQPELEAAIKSCATAAIVFGPTAEGPWHSAELQVLLNRAQRERGEFRLIPILLEGANPETIGSFLEMRTWVDFGKDPFEIALGRLISGITGEPPEDSASYNLPDEPAPYRSLQRFEARHSDYFFGRDPDIKKLVYRLAQQPFVAIVGASGSGKSSLVRAGLATMLAREKLPELANWKTLTVIPGARPLRELARAFLRMTNVAEAELTDRLDKEVTRYQENDGVFVDQLLDQDGSWLIVIDQFEEVFTQDQIKTNDAGSACDQTKQLIAVLNRTIESSGGRVRVLLTLRADFLHRCLEFKTLKDLLQDNQFLLGQLEDTGLREAIVRPANKVGALFEKGLVERILSDVLDQSGSLPLLQHALRELWQKRRGAWLTNAAYDKTGGVEGALRKRADETYAGLTDRQQQIARNIFVRLTTLGDGVSDTRRRANRSELYLSGFEHAEIDEVLRSLSSDRGRLIEVSEAAVEVTHEAIIQKWPTLRNWLDANRADVMVHRELTDAANKWEKSHLDERLRDRSLLYTGKRLAVACDRTRKTHSPMNKSEISFLKASRRAQANQRLLLLVSAFSILFAVVLFRHYLTNEVEKTLVRNWVEAVQNNRSVAIPLALESLRKQPPKMVLDELKQRWDADATPQYKFGLAYALAAFGEVKVEYLCSLIPDLHPDEVDNLVTALGNTRDASLRKIDALANGATHEENWRLKTRYAVVALHLEDESIAADMCRTQERPDPIQRTIFIDSIPAWHGNVAKLAKYCRGRSDSALKSGVVLGLGRIPVDVVPQTERAEATEVLRTLYTTAKENVVHSSAGWALRQWGTALPDLLPTGQPIEGRNWFINSLTMTMLRIQGDSIVRKVAKAQTLTLTQELFICDREVTAGQFTKFLDDPNVSAETKQRNWAFNLRLIDEQLISMPEELPACGVSWYEAILFCNWLSQREDRVPCYERTGKKEQLKNFNNEVYEKDEWRLSPSGTGYRLLTEAEWELACRAGTMTIFCSGMDEELLRNYATFAPWTGRRASPCASKLPNGWGFFDMHGNAKEWCHDWNSDREFKNLDADKSGLPVWLFGATSPERVFRGGDWIHDASHCGSAKRFSSNPDEKTASHGFRVALSPSGQPLEGERPKK